MIVSLYVYAILKLVEREDTLDVGSYKIVLTAHPLVDQILELFHLNFDNYLVYRFLLVLDSPGRGIFFAERVLLQNVLSGRLIETFNDLPTRDLILEKPVLSMRKVYCFSEN